MLHRIAHDPGGHCLPLMHACLGGSVHTQLPCVRCIMICSSDFKSSTRYECSYILNLLWNLTTLLLLVTSNMPISSEVLLITS